MAGRSHPVRSFAELRLRRRRLTDMTRNTRMPAAADPAATFTPRTPNGSKTIGVSPLAMIEDRLWDSRTVVKRIHSTLRRTALLVLFCVTSGSDFAKGADAPPASLPAWPFQIGAGQRPGTYWWCPGSAFNKDDIDYNLQRFRDGGFGFVHMIPIYGARGAEDRDITYLSPQWMEMLNHTVRKAQALGLFVDMTTGTGWCFGGPNVPPQEACAQVVVTNFTVAAGQKPTAKLDRANTQGVFAFSADGKCVELSDKLGEDDRLNWIAEGGLWQVWAVSQKPTSKVKRPAAGGEGFMLNPIYADAIRHWLGRFTDAFARYDGPKPRAHYHDSFEYHVNWSPDLFAQFEKRRGYRLQNELPALLGKESNDRVARLKSDYRETISDMMIEDSMPLWFNWCRERGFLTRNQAHGSPANLLDLYALADIPETEMFHTDRRPLVAKFASSAAHVAGHNLVASETGTWLKEHFTETLADVQGLLDDLFVSGVNHVFFHGTCYSPDEAGWPGWLFYASTEMNPRNSIWQDAPTLTAYIARCQSVLQAGRSDNDVLVYWPIYDVWHKAAGLAENLTVHGASWFTSQPIGKLAEKLWARGFSFDYISDRQLAALKPADRVIVVPATEHIPLKTMEHLLRLADGGAKVVFDGALPKDVPGLHELEARRTELKKLLERAKSRVLVGDADALLAKAGVACETMVDHARLLFIRRKLGDGRYYFIANRGDKAVDGWLPLATKAKSVAIMDPMTGHACVAALREDRSSRRKEADVAEPGHVHPPPYVGGYDTEVYVQLAPGDSVVLRTFAGRKLNGPAWAYWKPAGDSIPLTGTWQVKFLRGGPALPPALETAKLGSWTELGGEEAQRFAGTALYTLAFDAPATDGSWWLDLGNVCQSARVRLNDCDLGTAIKPPFRVAVDALKRKGNVLEVEVTNVSANRIRDLDRRGVKWRNFYDINFVNINYKPFDASNWPLADSGLLGPVTLLPMKTFAPK